MMNVKDLKKLDKDDLLNLIGLETRRGPSDWIVPALSAFSVGLLVGAGVGLLLAPKTGTDLRSDLRNRLQGGQDALQQGNGAQAQNTQAQGSQTTANVSRPT
jgi:hypothetical protein